MKITDFYHIIPAIYRMTNDSQRRFLDSGIKTTERVLVPMTEDIYMVISNYSGNKILVDDYEHAEHLDIRYMYRQTGATVSYHGHVYDLRDITLKRFVRVLKKVYNTPCISFLGIAQYIYEFARKECD